MGRLIVKKVESDYHCILITIPSSGDNSHINKSLNNKMLDRFRYIQKKTRNIYSS